MKCCGWIAGISPQMLTLTLKALERDGLVVRRVFVDPAQGGIQVDTARPLADRAGGALIDWAQKNQAKVEAGRRLTRAPVTPQTCSNAG